MFFRFIGGLASAHRRCWGRSTLPSWPAKWRGRLVAAFQLNVVFGIMVAYISNYAIRTLHLARPVALASGRRRHSGRGVSDFAVWHSAQPPLLRIEKSDCRGAGRAQAYGRRNPEAELEDIAPRLPRSTPSRMTGLPLEVPLSALLAISIGAFNQLAGINAILYYLNNIFAAAGFSQISSDQQAIAIGATNFTFCVIGMSLMTSWDARHCC